MPKYPESVNREPWQKMGEQPSVFDYIPPPQHSAIIAGTSTYECGADIQKGIEDLKTGDGGLGLSFPSGIFPIEQSLKVYMGTRLYGPSSWKKGSDSPWCGATLVQAPGVDCDLIVSAHDPNFGTDDNWAHATIIERLFLQGDRTTNKRGSGLNLYRLGENSLITNVAAYGFPRHGIRIYDYAAPARIDSVSVHNNGSWIVCTASASTDAFTATAHGLLAGERIKLKSIGGAVPGGITAWREYYVVSVTDDTFQVSTTSGGAAVDLSDAGSGTIIALAGCGVSFESALNSHNSMGLISGDNNAKALVEVFAAYSNSVYIDGIKAERTTSGLTPYPGNDIVLSCVNLNGGSVSVGSINVYASEPGGRAIIHNDNDGISAGGPVHIVGACTFNPAGSESRYTYGYEHRAEAIGITVAEWCGGPRHPEMEFYWADRIVRALRMRSEYGGITLEGHDLSNPNPIKLNSVNFGAEDLGGIVSVNSEYSGNFPNWQKLSTNASNNAMFVRFAATLFEVMFGAAANANGVNPGTSAFKVDASRATVNGELKVDCRTKGGYPFVAYIDEAKNSVTVQEAEQPFGIEFYKAVSGGSNNVDWQIVVPSGAKTLRFLSDGVQKAELNTDGVFSVPNALKIVNASVYYVTTGPEGVYTGEPGSLALKSDGTVWRKSAGSDASGWRQIGGLALTGESLSVDGAAAFIRLSKLGTLKFEIDADGIITILPHVAGPVLSKAANAALEVQDAGGVSKFKADTSGVTNAGSTTLSALTASRPLKLDGSKIVTAAKIDLAATADVEATGISTGQVLSWNGAGCIGRPLGTASGQVAEGNHLHTGVYSPVGHDHAGVYASKIGGATGSVTLAKITPGGADGALAWNDDGQITSFTAPT